MLEKVLAGGGVAAALGASTCCVLPLGLGAAGVGGTWVSSLAVLGPYQTPLRVIAILLLGAAFWLVYARRTATTDGTVCPPSPSQRATKLALWLGAALMALVLTSGWWERPIA